ncbi:MAG: TonB-dependent receptor [Bacteroidales bacterium]|jgi:hypothetical protein|nr:TonB-dependent receptor [Bacteroidales bacterium]
MKYIVGLFLLLLSVIELSAQHKIRIFGFVSDSRSGEKLIGATLYDTVAQQGAVSDNDGYFSLAMSASACLRVSYIGYSPVFIAVKDYEKDTLLRIQLEAVSSQLNEFVVEAKREMKANVVGLNSMEMSYMPSIGSKPDIMRQLQALPGIAMQNESSSTLLVRGGDPGQNLYLIDNVPIIYVNHLGGFFSVFNPDIINQIDVYKGGFPSRFGGKISSVVDITQKEGDRSLWKGNFSAGITDLSFAVEGHCSQNTALIVTGRKTLIDLLMWLFSSLSNGGDYRFLYGFHDVNAKFSWKINEKNSMIFNFYQGDDYFSTTFKNLMLNNEKETSKIRNKWGNILFSARWKHIVSSKLFANHTLSFTRYRLQQKSTLTSADTSIQYQYLNFLQDISLKTEWKYSVSPIWEMQFGGNVSLLSALPSYVYATNQNQTKKRYTHAFQTNLYWENIINWKKIKLIAGVRGVDYLTKDYTHFSFEPRANIRVCVAKNNYIHLSYSKISQQTHLLMSSGTLFQNETWIFSNKSVLPAYAHQYTVGWQGTFLKDILFSEITVFYKTMCHLATYKDGYSSLIGDENWENRIAPDGKGKSFGCEFLLKAAYGKWNGFVAYTLSKTTRKYPLVNQGKIFLFDYDRPHVLSLFVGCKITPKLNLSLSWTYMTGQLYTPAIGRQLMITESGDYQAALIYGEKNSDRMKDYHRLDVALNYEKIGKRGNKVVWTVSVYNLYNRLNPYIYYYNHDNSSERYTYNIEPLHLYQITLFPVIPSFSYKVFFRQKAKQEKEHLKITRQQQKGDRFKKWLYHEN